MRAWHREREREEEEEWLEGEGTAVPGRVVRWYPRGSSAAGVKIRERVEEVGLCRSSEFLAPGRLENIGTGNIRGISSSFLLSLSLSWFKGIQQMPGSSDGQDY